LPEIITNKTLIRISTQTTEGESN